MARLPASTLSTFKAELRKIEARETSLKNELEEAQNAANYLRKFLKGAEKDDEQKHVSHG